MRLRLRLRRDARHRRPPPTPATDARHQRPPPTPARSHDSGLLNRKFNWALLFKKKKPHSRRPEVLAKILKCDPSRGGPAKCRRTTRSVVHCLLCLSPGGSSRVVLAGRPPAPCGVVAPWLRRAPSVVCGCTITEMGHTHDPYGGVRDLVLCAPEPVGCRPSVSQPPPCAPVRARA